MVNQSHYFHKISFCIFIFVFLFACKKDKNAVILPPEELYGQLFIDVQMNRIFPDGKTFVDCIPSEDPDIIRTGYKKLKDPTTQEISDFVKKNFIIPPGNNSYVTDSSGINEHITKLWQILKRPADSIISGTLIPLPKAYIVPGGRFREIYYWDSYFTMLGLQADGEIAAIQDMVDNFTFLIDKYGHIPNGNRTYYLSRSQPPFYSLMLALLAEEKGDSVFIKYLPFLRKEYNYWMEDQEQTDSFNNAFKHVVRMPGGEVMNRFWDASNTPRAESYREDLVTASEASEKKPGINKEEVFRNLRAAAESGWDFSSRWLSADENGTFHLHTIHTTEIVPVDLNCLMYFMELSLSKAYLLSNNQFEHNSFYRKSEARKNAIQKYFWDAQTGFYMDFNFKRNKTTNILSLAGVFPLFFNIAENDQAEKVALKLKTDFLKPGGLIATTNFTGQQWDAPNGWAPLQWIAISGLQNYDINELARKISDRWTFLNLKVYRHTFKMLEKYNVNDVSLVAGGGEYPNQDGFGWTNGVYQKLTKVKNVTE